jgi:hypothetical protein
MFNHLQTFPNLCIMPHLKLFKTYVFGTNKLKITIHMDLWKYGQILTIQKSLTIN